jgi:hypothetical protein
MEGRPWFNESMWARLAFGLIFACGFAVLAYDLIAIPKRRDAGAREETTAAAGS